jgi:hypothetical protein
MITLLTRRNLLLGSAVLSVTLSRSKAFADSLTPDEARHRQGGDDLRRTDAGELPYHVFLFREP